MNKTRKIIFLTFIILIIFTAYITAGCSKKNNTNDTHIVDINGQNAVITYEEGTYSEGKINIDDFTYEFAYSMNGSLSIIYPNGYKYSQTDVGGAIGVPIDYDASYVESLGYIDGFTLARALSSASYRPETVNGSRVSPIESVVLLLVGIWLVFSPKSAWWVSVGWRFKNAEPSDLALMLNRIGGGILVFIGIISFLA